MLVEQRGLEKDFTNNQKRKKKIRLFLTNPSTQLVYDTYLKIAHVLVTRSRLTRSPLGSIDPAPSEG